MIKKSQIFNFDVYSDFAELLDGKNFAFPLNEKTVKKIRNKKTVQVITLTSTSQINDNVLKHFPRLKLLITRSTGTDHVNLADCKRYGIIFKNIPDYGSFFVAEHTFAMLLSFTRRIITADKKTNKGEFNYQDCKGFTLEGKILGCLGTGRIGLETIKLAKAFKMKVLAFDVVDNQPVAKKIGFRYVSLDKLLKEADVVSLHIPLTEETYHLIDESAIKKMKKGVILINTSRGGVINTKALIAHIKKFRYVALDVLEDEPEFSQNCPLLKFDNVLITPHCAFYTDKTFKVIAEKTKKIIEKFAPHHKKINPGGAT